MRYTIEKDVITYTFLVDVDAELAAKDPQILAAKAVDAEIDPVQFKAMLAVDALFRPIILTKRPAGVEVSTEYLSAEKDDNRVSDRVKEYRQKVKDGELTGQVVTFHLGIEAPKSPQMPSSSWLTHEVWDDPNNGVILLDMRVKRIIEPVPS